MLPDGGVPMVYYPDAKGKGKDKGKGKGRADRLRWLRRTYAVRKAQGGLIAANLWLSKQAWTIV